MQGQLDFALIGIIAGISRILANADISLFVSSTFLTDYILVKRSQALETQRVLSVQSTGYFFANPIDSTSSIS